MKCWFPYKHDPNNGKSQNSELSLTNSNTTESRPGLTQILETMYAGVKKSKKFSHVPRASTSKVLLVLLPNDLSLSRKDRLSVNFLLVHRTLGENICLSCLKFNLSQAPGQVIFLPLIYTGVKNL